MLAEHARVGLSTRTEDRLSDFSIEEALEKNILGVFVCLEARILWKSLVTNIANKRPRHALKRRWLKL